VLRCSTTTRYEGRVNKIFTGSKFVFVFFTILLLLYAQYYQKISLDFLDIAEIVSTDILHVTLLFWTPLTLIVSTHPNILVVHGKKEVIEIYIMCLGEITVSYWNKHECYCSFA